MKRKRTFTSLALLLAILMLGIGYAAISDIDLSIGGTATASPSDNNFKVRFTGTPEVSDANKVIATITDDKNAVITVKDLTAKGDTVSATYTIENASEDLSAELSVVEEDFVNDNSEYFDVTYSFKETTVAKKTTTTITVTVELSKTPVTKNETTNITIPIKAVPVQA